MAQLSKSTPILLTAIAVLIGYAGYSGEGIELLGMTGLQTRVQRVDSIEDTLKTLKAKIDTAKRDLAKESVDDIKKRVVAYRASLAVLRTLVPEQREVANLIDDVTMRARQHGVTLSNFGPQPPQPGPPPFDTYSYQFSAVGRYHNIGRFLTDIASLRRIIVPGDVTLSAADKAQARAFGDTTAMVEAKFTVRTYVKAKAAEDSVHAK